MTGAWLPILTAAVLAGVWPAWRGSPCAAGAFRPRGSAGAATASRATRRACAPSAAPPADEAFKQSERSRLLLAARRLLYWVLAVLVLGAPVTGLSRTGGGRAQLRGLQARCSCPTRSWSGRRSCGGG